GIECARAAIANDEAAIWRDSIGIAVGDPTGEVTQAHHPAGLGPAKCLEAYIGTGADAGQHRTIRRGRHGLTIETIQCERAEALHLNTVPSERFALTTGRGTFAHHVLTVSGNPIGDTAGQSSGQ